MARVLVKDAKGCDCAFCPHGAVQAAIDDNKRLPREKRRKTAEIRGAMRVVATCDKPVVNTPVAYQVCYARMCYVHIGATPQEGMHWCPRHKPNADPCSAHGVPGHDCERNQ